MIVAPKGGSIMTTLGKILASLNLVLSLAVGAFIVMTYVSRTNWEEAYNKQLKAAQAAQSTVDAYHEEANKARNDLKLPEQNWMCEKTVLVTQQKNDAAAIEKLNNALKAETDKAGQFQVAQANAAAELERRQKEVELLRQLRTDHENKIKQMEGMVQELRNSATESLLAAHSEQDRNIRLVAENERLTKELQKAIQSASGAGAGAGPAKNPPPDGIQGIVKATDPSGYVTLSIGSDAGLVKGNTLEVFRLKPDPTYLGTIEILAVRPHEAVGKPLTRPRGLIQVGDRVSS